MQDRSHREPPPESDPPRDRRAPPGPLESLFQEAVRRATGLGISGLASTEEAVRKAVGERMPPEWSEFLSGQSEELRRELIERLAAEFGEFLRSDQLDVRLRELLEAYEVRVSFTLSADKREADGPASVELLRRKE